jgi:hypothetical protein
MTIHANATYRDGALHLAQPLMLPENASVVVTITPTAAQPKADIEAIRPKSPKLTPEEFDAIISKNAVHVGTLPPDFSREDIYSDHD